MTNFLQFVEDDISSKRTLLSTMPVTTKLGKRKFNEKVLSMIQKYEEYKELVKKYLDVKSKSFMIADDRRTEEKKEIVANLEHTRFILNPSNTYFEKIGFDTLFYHISNYQDFKFDTLTGIINEFLDKFETAGIILQKTDFDYTSYVNEFMSSFLEVRNQKTENYLSVSEIFERIYWVNPEIISHIELNFRKLIKSNEKKFIDYMVKKQNEILTSSSMNYEVCLNKLATAYRDLMHAEKENITDIIEKAESGEIDINNYFEDSKVRTTAYSSLMIDPVNLYDNDSAEKFYEELSKLKQNVEEYKNYVKFIPLFEDFKNTFFKAGTNETDKNSNNKGVKNIEGQINSTETKLEKINKKIFGGKSGFFGPKENDIKKLKFESVKIANELYTLYNSFEDEYFKEKVLSSINSTFTVSDLLHLYYSFDCYKKSAIKRVFDMNNYEEVIEFSDSFDKFASNPTNVMIDGVLLFEDSNIAKNIINKYRLVNINIAEEDLNPDDLDTLLDKIDLVLRIREIEKSSTSVDKIWFMSMVAKLIQNKE